MRIVTYRSRELSPGCGFCRECAAKSADTSWLLGRNGFNRLVDRGRRSIIYKGQPWLTVTFAVTGVST